jgi:hypothetical protein
MIGPAGTAIPHPYRVGDRSGRRRTSVRISPPPSWSRPLTGDWPTTQSVTSSTPCCGTTPCSSTSLGLHRWTTREPTLLFRFVAAAYEMQVARGPPRWPFESWGRFLPEHITAVSMLDRLLHHCHTVATDGDTYRMKQARAKGATRVKTS